ISRKEVVDPERQPKIGSVDVEPLSNSADRVVEPAEAAVACSQDDVWLHSSGGDVETELGIDAVELALAVRTLRRRIIEEGGADSDSERQNHPSHSEADPQGRSRERLRYQVAGEHFAAGIALHAQRRETDAFPAEVGVDPPDRRLRNGLLH